MITHAAASFRYGLAILLATVLAAAVVGCGENPPAVEVPPSEVSPSRTESPPPEDDAVQVTGTVVAGVEPGCLLLETDTERYLLVGERGNRLEPDEHVTVTGIANPGAPTTCMEGIPLTVTAVHPEG